MTKGEWIVVRRLVTLAVSFCLVLAIGVTRVDRLFAQGEVKKEAQQPKAESPAKETAKTEPAKTEPAKTEPAKKDETKILRDVLALEVVAGQLSPRVRGPLFPVVSKLP